MKFSNYTSFPLIILLLLVCNVSYAEQKKMVAILEVGGDENIPLRTFSSITMAIRKGATDILAPNRFYLAKQDLLKEKKDKNCTTEKCILAVLRDVQADYGISALLSQQDKTYNLVIKLFASKSSSLVHIETIRISDFRKLEEKSIEATKALISSGIKNALEANFGNLRITSIPHGASILLNGKKTNRLTPSTFWKRAVGNIDIQLAKEGYEGVQTQVKIPNNGSIVSIELRLQSKLAHLNITGQLPSGIPCRGTIWLNGKEIGSSPFRLDTLASKHQVIVGCEGLKGLENVQLKEKQEKSVTVKVEPFGPQELERVRGKYRISRVLDYSALGASLASFTYARLKYLTYQEIHGDRLKAEDAGVFSRLEEDMNKNHAQYLTGLTIGCGILTASIVHHFLQTRKYQNKFKKLKDIQKH